MPIPRSLAAPSDLLRGLFLKKGITFPSNFITPFSYAPNFRKGFYLNERTGEFHVRATRREIPKFEKYLSQLYLSQLAAGPPIVDGVVIFPPKTSVFKVSPVVIGSGDLIIRSGSDLH